ncbi:MAG: hypothetical protein ABIR28_14840, partial [Vicinamibacteria bacterium]
MSAFLVHIHALRIDPNQDRLKEILDKFGERFGSPRVRCPQCTWEPKREDRWACTCAFTWHTFDTGGVCPACDHQWQETMCLQCFEWSKHAAWY